MLNRRGRDRRASQGGSPAALVLIGCLALLGACSRDRLQLETPTRLNASEGSGAAFSWAYYTSIAAQGDSVAAAWMGVAGARNRNIELRQSGDGGKTWTPETALNAGEFGDTISVVPKLVPLPSPGSLLAIWQARRNFAGQKFILLRRSTDFGKSWTPVARLNAKPQSFLPAVVARGDGNLLVAYSDERNIAHDVYANCSHDGGKTWLPEDVRVDTEPRGESDAPSVALGSDGHGYVLWEEGGKEGRRLLVAHSPDGGATWEAPRQVDPPGMPATAIWPSLVEAGGRLTAVWTGGIAGTAAKSWLWVSSSNDRGVTWSAPLIFYEGGTQPFFQTIAEGQHVYLVWHGGDSRNAGGIYFNASDDGGATWRAPLNEPLRLDRDAQRALHPRLAVDREHVAVTWQEEDKRVLLAVSTDGGRTWPDRPALVASTTEKNRLRYPQVAASGGAAYVLWEDWADTQGMRKTLADVDKVAPIDVYVRRASLR